MRIASMPDISIFGTKCIGAIRMIRQHDRRLGHGDSQPRTMKSYLMQTRRSASQSSLAPMPQSASGIMLYLPLLIVLVANLIPLLGVTFWGWDTFVLLMLYWLETVIIAFWTLLRILVGADFSRSLIGEIVSRLFMFGFFLVHSGGFMLGHFIFLWAFFGKEWSNQIPVTNSLSALPVEAFWQKMVVANGLLIPLAVSFIGRGATFLIEMAKLPLWRRLVGEDSADGKQAGALVSGLYTRIITMHIVIIAGAAFAQKYGALAPLILLILAKAAVDIWLFFKFDIKSKGTSAIDTVNVK